MRFEILLLSVLGLFGVCLVSKADDFIFDDAPTCGGHFNTSTGNATLTGKGHGNCTWTISLDKAAPIYITFQRVTLGQDGTLVVYDGGKNDTNRVVKINSSHDMFVVVAFYKTVTIETSTNNNTDVAFMFNYQANNCTLLYVTYATKVVSPYYLPGRGSVTCQYMMSGLPQDADKVAALAFTKFGITSGNVQISDGNKTVSYKGSSSAKLPDDFIGTETFAILPDITVNFTLDNSPALQTFTAFFSTVDSLCTREFDVVDNETYSLTIPADQAPLTDCRLIFRAQEENTLLLNFTSLTLQRGSDSVLVTDGGSLGATSVSDLNTIPDIGDIVTSSGRELWVRLAVGEYTGNRIFTVTVTEQDNGGRIYSNDNVSMKGNASEANYYYQMVGKGGQVSVNLNNGGPLYPKASVDFYDGTQLSNRLIASFKTDTPFFPVTSSGSSMLMVARNFDGAQNFSASYNFMPKTCDMLSAGKADQYSPSLGSQDSCRWIVKPQSKSGLVTLKIDSLQLKEGETVTVYGGVTQTNDVIELDSSSNGQQLPTVSSTVSQGLELVFTRNSTCKNCTTDSFVTASYKTSQDCGGFLSTKVGELSSPDYPNVYSLNTDCVWTTWNTSANTSTGNNTYDTFTDTLDTDDLEASNSTNTTKQWLFLSFSDLQLGQGHSVKVGTVNVTTKVIAEYSGMTLPGDLIVPMNSTRVEFTSVSRDKSANQGTARGFKANYWKLDCGGNLTTTNATGMFVTPGFDKPVTKATLCVWIVQFPAHGGNSTVHNSVQFQIRLGKGVNATHVPLTIHDGSSVRDPILHYNTSGKTIARTNTIVIIYNFTASAADEFGEGLGLRLNYSAFSCNASMQCGDGVCIHPDWICNGRDDCGDMSDERNCTSPPQPPAAIVSGMVKSYWIGVSIFLGLLFGALLAFLIPAIYRRIKYPNYSQLRDLSVPVPT